MRIRPVFLIILLSSCISVLAFAALFQPHAPAILQMHVERTQSPTQGFTRLFVHLSDPEGLPIDKALIVSDATMTNMDMGTFHSTLKAAGRGDYIAQLQLNMTGPWAITVNAQAQGFDSLRQVVQVQVT